MEQIASHHKTCTGEGDRITPLTPTQSELTVKKPTLSQRLAPRVLDAPAFRKRWVSILIALVLFAWLDGYETPIWSPVIYVAGVLWCSWMGLMIVREMLEGMRKD